MINKCSKVWNDCPICGKHMYITGGFLICSSNTPGYSHYIVSYKEYLEPLKMVTITYDRLIFQDDKRDYRVERVFNETRFYCASRGAWDYNKPIIVKNVLPLSKINFLNKVKVLMLFS